MTSVTAVTRSVPSTGSGGATGSLRWDTRVADHLPVFKLRDVHAAQVLTVKDILSHRSGLPYNTYDRKLEADEPYPLLVAQLGTVPPLCDAGQCYSYQNVAFSLIGDLVFASTGDFYSHQVEKRLFHPLGMYNATYGRDVIGGGRDSLLNLESEVQQMLAQSAVFDLRDTYD